MSLDPSTLHFTQEPYPSSGKAAAERIVDTYIDYASRAQAGPATPTFTGKERDVMLALLRPALETSNPSPAAFAQALAAAVTAFWLTPPVPFVAPPYVGAVSAAPCAPVMVPALVSSMVPTAAPAQAEAVLRAALDAGTRAVIVTLVAPPPAAPVVAPLS